MTKIRGTCPSCGDVRFDATEVVVRVCRDNNVGSYRFRCPECLGIVIKDADNRIVSLLEQSGVLRENWTLPREMWEEHSDGPVITLDDVLTFHEELEKGLDLDE